MFTPEFVTVGAMMLSNASQNPFEAIQTPIVEFINMAAGPAIAIVGALGAIYCILLGVKLAKAEEQQDREKAKNALKNAIIGFLLIFVLMVALKVSITPLKNWMTSATGERGSSGSAIELIINEKC